MAMDENELARIRDRYADEAPDVLAWRVDHVRESWRDARTLLAEVGRLGADRAALFGLWVFRNGGVWQIRTESVPPPTFATREEAEEAVLKWARDWNR
jgi:hypothetical protein